MGCINLAISLEKFNKKKEEIIYFEKHAVFMLNKNADLSLFPLEYKELMRKSDEDNNDALDFYRYNTVLKVIEIETYNIYNAVQEVIDSLDNVKFEILMAYINTNKVHHKLMQRTYNSAEIDLIKKDGTIISQSMLSIYEKKYENTEILSTLLWFSNIKKKEEINFSFNGLTYPNGTVIKSRLIKSIKNNFEDTPNIKKVLDNVYNNELRNAISHNDVFIDNEKSMLVSIETSKDIISFDDFFEIFYLIQELHNFITMFLYKTLMNEQKLYNKGIIQLLTYEQEEKTCLELAQLWPFYENDKINEKKLKVKTKYENNYYHFYDNEGQIIYKIQENEDLNNWYHQIDKQIIIGSVFPDIFEDNDIMLYLGDNLASVEMYISE